MSEQTFVAKPQAVPASPRVIPAPRQVTGSEVKSEVKAKVRKKLTEEEKIAKLEKQTKDAMKKLKEAKRRAAEKEAMDFYHEFKDKDVKTAVMVWEFCKRTGRFISSVPDVDGGKLSLKDYLLYCMKKDEGICPD